MKFEELLKDDLIDLPEDFYDEELLDTDPEYIPSIFGQLEDKNLKIIRRQQENEQILEQRKYDFERKQVLYGGEVRQLEDTKAKHERELAEGRAMLEHLKSQANGGEKKGK